MTVVLIDNMCKKFGRDVVFSGLNLEVNSGDIYGLLGLSGSGKTTLLRMLLSLSFANSGIIKLFGKHIKAHNENRHKIYYLPEGFAPAPEMTGREVVKTLVKFHRPSIDMREIHKWAARFGLSKEDLDGKTRSYSRSQVQKLGLVVTFSCNAKLYLLDEPMRGLDYKTRDILRTEIKKLQKDKGATFIITGHNFDDLEQLCTRVAVLNDGKFAINNSASYLKRKYGSLAAAVDKVCVTKTVDADG